MLARITFLYHNKEEMAIRFEPNPEKEAINIREHGISFATAQEAFDDPFQVVALNYCVDGEQREQIIGMTKNLMLLFVVFVDHSQREELIFRIISARKAEYNEERIYEEQLG